MSKNPRSPLILWLRRHCVLEISLAVAACCILYWHGCRRLMGHVMLREEAQRAEDMNQGTRDAMEDPAVQNWKWDGNQETTN